MSPEAATQNPVADRTAVQRIREGVTWRSILIGVALAPFHCYWLIHMEIVRGRGFASTVSLFFNVILTLLVLTLANHAIRRLWPRAALARTELLVIYTMLCMVTALCSIDMLKPLICLMPYGYWYATPENGWEELFHKHMPDFLAVTDLGVLKPYFEGGATMYTPERIVTWLWPTLIWTAFIMVLLGVMVCISAVLRKRWMEQERLTYPIVLLPYDLTDPGAALFRDKMMWVGFALAGLYDLLNGLRMFFPAVPAWNAQRFNLRTHITAKPWSGIGATPLTMFPFVVGLGYLLPVDLLFSCWFFFLIWKAENIVATALGLPVGRGYWPYAKEQALGAYIAICVFAVFAARAYFGRVLRLAFSSAKAREFDQEALGPRAAVYLGLGGVAALVIFSRSIGVPVWAGIAFFVLYYIVAVAITRMRAQLGPPTHDLHHVGPDAMLPAVFGTGAFSPRALTAFTFYRWFNRAYRSHPMPHQLEGFKLCERTGMSQRRMAAAVMVAILVGTLSHFWAYLHIAHNLGVRGKMTGWGTYGYGREAFGRLQTWLEVGQQPDYNVSGAIIVGLITALGLMALRSRFVWLPLHPLGYAISGEWSMRWSYSSLFIAWLAKVIIMRYGGYKMYMRLLPLFMGLIIGEFVVGGMWSIIGVVWGVEVFAFWRG
ncbi:MAG: hypothetical protein PVH68_19785 [Armatimonadota bacterium]|jgi:hypothetical protein